MFSTAGLEPLWSHNEKGYEDELENDCYRSVAEGCKICLILGYLAIETDDEAPLVGRIGGYVNPVKREMHILSSDDTSTSNPTSNPSDDPLGGHFPGRALVKKTSERAVTAAKSWLRECQENHPECGIRGERPQLPTRVLDVASMSDSPSVRLHIPEENQRGEYLALSYCWGGEQPFIMTTQNLDTMKTGFPDSELPSTLKDAIQVTRRLGIRFLWVDALCIMQDSPDDKSREIARMGQIYKNATATIMAAGAKSASEGFLKDNAQETVSCEVFLTAPDGTSGTVTICPLEIFDFSSMPLSKRSWCFQEYVLSRRHLFYTDKEVVWQCRSSKVVTISRGSIRYTPRDRLEPFGISGAIISGAHDSSHKTDSRPRGVLRGESGEEAGRTQLWKSILRNYTRRAMNDPDDRLNAIMGVVEELESRWSDKCIFGLWRDRFIEELAWHHVYEGRYPYFGTRSGRAPSWSWASTNSPTTIEAGRLDKTMLATLVKISEDEREVVVRGPMLVPTGRESPKIGYSSPTYYPWATYMPHALALVRVGGERYRRIALASFEDIHDVLAGEIWCDVVAKEKTVKPGEESPASRENIGAKKRLADFELTGKDAPDHEEQLDRLIQSITEENGHLDGLVAAAPYEQSVSATGTTQYRDCLTVDLTWVVQACKSAARQMLAHNTRGTIVLVAHLSSLVANKALLSPVLGSPRAALVQLTRDLAMR
ncbi:HET-domain-containing protein [Apiospora sp. TS-2023a]